MVKGGRWVDCTKGRSKTPADGVDVLLILRAFLICEKKETRDPPKKDMSIIQEARPDTEETHREVDGESVRDRGGRRKKI